MFALLHRDVEPRRLITASVALVSCPCHLVLTFPLLAAGAATIGFQLALGATVAVSSLVFITSLVIFMRLPSPAVIE